MQCSREVHDKGRTVVELSRKSFEAGEPTQLKCRGATRARAPDSLYCSPIWVNDSVPDTRTAFAMSRLASLESADSQSRSTARRQRERSRPVCYGPDAVRFFATEQGGLE